MIKVKRIILIFKLQQHGKIKNKIKKRYIIFAAIVIIYVVIQILWINFREAGPLWDQETTYELAKSMVEGNVEEFLENRNNIHRKNT